MLGEIFFRRGANLESREAHIHPKNTQVPPPPPGLRAQEQASSRRGKLDILHEQ